MKSLVVALIILVTYPAFARQDEPKLEFHPTIKDKDKAADPFLGIDEALGQENVWRTIEADKLLRAYARGQHGQIPKVQKIQNKYDKESPRIMRTELKLPRP